MPYVTKAQRAELQSFDRRKPENPGELNYVITEAIRDYLTVKGLSYQTINDVLGALDGASKEFYRRVAEPYEDVKRQLNGDVYNGFVTPSTTHREPTPCEWPW